MSVHPLAGTPVTAEQKADIQGLLAAYTEEQPDPKRPEQRVSFGTSGHRGTSRARTFNAAHIVAICEAVSEYRRSKSITGPLFIGRDTHALSESAFATALDVFLRHGADVRIDSGSPFTPTPVISHAILRANARGSDPLADGVIITPSHNPPEDGGIKYNPPDGGPAGTDVTAVIEARANELLSSSADRVRAARDERQPIAVDLRSAYVDDLRNVIDMDAIAASGIRIGVDPLGGASVDYWEQIAEAYGLNIEVVNSKIDPAFAFMSLDWDGRIRMDCSSQYAMAGLIQLRDEFDIAFGLDPDADRHGIVTRSTGLMNPNHYLSVAAWHLLRTRQGWKQDARIGKTVVTSGMINRVAEQLGREVFEVPVGFKWFVDGLREGTLAFVGEESAGATLLRMNGDAWTTDKDGIVMCLLAAEITAKHERDPAELYADLEARFGSPAYRRIDAAATREQKQALKTLSADAITTAELAGEKITGAYTNAPGNNAPIGGLKVETASGWFAARPSGTEDVYKIYAESFKGEEHLAKLIEEAQAIVDTALSSSGSSKT